MHTSAAVSFGTAVLFAAAVVGHGAHGGAVRRDLDVAVPPGFPLDWARALPVTGENPVELLTKPREQKPEGTRVGPTLASVDLRLPRGADLLRILTVDLVYEIPWVREHEFGRRTFLMLRKAAPAPLPPVPRSAYWAALAPLLRMQLHPSLVSRDETLAHVLEFGEAALPAIDAASSEPALKADCDWLRAQIGKLGAAAAAPLPADTPERTMLHRFVVQELTRSHALAHDGEFGRALPFLGGETLSILLEYTFHADRFLRRNAVAALGSFREKEAGRELLRVAVESDDPVSRVRALGALARGKRRECVPALLDRLPRAPSGPEAAAVLYTLGCIGDDSAIPGILAFADGRGTPDVLLSALEALARIPTADLKNKERTWLRATEEKVRSDPERWKATRNGTTADVPDSGTTRALMMIQLIRIAGVRAAPGDAAAADRLFDCLAESDRMPRAPRVRNAYANPGLEQILPSAQLLFLDVLATCGERGEKLLLSLLDSEQTDPALRAWALRRLPDRTAVERAEALLRGAETPPSVRIFALDLLARVEARSASPAARDVLQKLLWNKPLPRDPETALLCYTALCIVGPKHHLAWRELQTALAAVESPEPDLKHGAWAEQRVDELLTASLAGGAQPDQHAAVMELVRKAPNGVASPSWTSEKDASVRRIEALLRALHDHGEDKQYREIVRDDVLRSLSLGVVGVEPNQLRFGGDAPLAEQILLECGRTGDAAAVDALVRLAGKKIDPDLRPYLCYALGMTRNAKAARSLAVSLRSESGLERYCAYAALKNITGIDAKADWIFGGAAEVREAREKYERWALEH